MHLMQFFRSLFSSKIGLFTLSILLAISTLLQPTQLEAMGYGKTNKIFQYGGTKWNEVYLDMNGLHFTANIPNYIRTDTDASDVEIIGEIKGGEIYMIFAPIKADFSPPKNKNQFLSLMKQVFLDSIVVSVTNRELGAKYTVDVIPINDDFFWRLLCTEDRLIWMLTKDQNEQRRLKFFNSIRIKKGY